MSCGLPTPDFNAPHGVRWSDPYFNPPDWPEFSDEDIVEFILNEHGDTPGGMAYEGAREDGSEEDAWWVETPTRRCPDDTDRDGNCGKARCPFCGPEREPAGPFDSYEEAVSYILAEGGDLIEERMAELELERQQDEYFDDPRL